MIRIILFMCRFKFVNEFMQKLTLSFQVSQKQTARVLSIEERCQEELNKIKNKEIKSVIYKQPV
jgi:hypothetical protein